MKALNILDAMGMSYDVPFGTITVSFHIAPTSPATDNF